MTWTESDHARLVALKQQRAALRRGPDELKDKTKMSKLTVEIKEIKRNQKSTGNQTQQEASRNQRNSNSAGNQKKSKVIKRDQQDIKRSIRKSKEIKGNQPQKEIIRNQRKSN